LIRIFLACIVFVVSICPIGYARLWIDKDGRELEADLISKNSSSVILRLTDGREFTVVIDRFSEADQKWLATAQIAVPAPGIPVQENLLVDQENLWDPLNSKMDKLQEAERLLKRAERLGNTASITAVGEAGVWVNGVSLTGVGVIRPEAFRARAAELMMEAAIDKSNVKSMQQALAIWAQLDDWQTPIGYLRRVAVSMRGEFALYCKVTLARYYLRQGDQASALGIVKPYASQPTSSEMVGRAQAIYAEQLLLWGKFDEAAALATQVRDNCPIREIEWDAGNANAAATGILARLPTMEKSRMGPVTTAESQLLVNIEANPRAYFSLGQNAYASKNLPKAIEYWGQYRKRFPNENEARQASLRIANAYAEMGNTDEALKAFSVTWILYPEFREAWQARLGAAEIHQKAGNYKAMQDLLEEGESKGRTPEAISQMVGALARMFIKTGQTDLAAQKYILLLSKYGDQDAAKDAWVELKKNSGQIKNWRAFTQLVQDWLLGKDGRAPGSYGGAAMTVAARSELRRLALSFYIQNGQDSAAVNWLKAIGYKSDVQDRDWIIRDEAWLYSETATGALRQLGKMSQRDINQAISLGLNAWRLAPDYQEGYDGLVAAYRLASTNKASDIRTKEVVKELEAQLGSNNNQRVTEMLIALYEAIGNPKAADRLRRN
jgi:outer membrane protein assembly factor BamD (BamD/ComL family)